LRDAATYITKLPKREHDKPAWLAAIQALMAGRRARRRYHAAQDHARVVSWRDDAGAAQEAGQDVQDRQVKDASVSNHEQMRSSPEQIFSSLA
jgi:hypothetical protein